MCKRSEFSDLVQEGWSVFGIGLRHGSTRKSPIIETLVSEGLVESVPMDKSITVAFRLRHEPLTLDRVILLRWPHVREWFYQTFSKPGPYYEKVFKTEKALSSFEELLPSMLFWNGGGCAFTQGVGCWMRYNEVNALVFPSARRDWQVTLRNGEMVDFDGWNLVMYKDSSRPLCDLFADASLWETRVVAGLELLSASRDAAAEGSLGVRGIEEWHARYKQGQYLLFDKAPS